MREVDHLHVVATVPGRPPRHGEVIAAAWWSGIKPVPAVAEVVHETHILASNHVLEPSSSAE